MKLPLVTIGLWPAVTRKSGWVFYFMLAPFPYEEQREGHLFRALFRFTIYFNLRPLKFQVGCWADDRLAAE